jgi:Zn-dependent M28 family amino/carboxypeptidase
MEGGRWMHRSEVMKAVVERGAAGLLYQTTIPGHLPMTGTCWVGGLSPVPGVGISLEDGERIRRWLVRGEEVRCKLTMTNLSGPGSSANVVGEIPGRGSGYILVGAHLDAWDNGRGAVDNGSGTVVVIEAARALASLGVEPEASIRFVLFMGEEAGLAGSIAYAETHGGELPRCRAMINCDMEGMPLGVRVMGHEEAGPFFTELCEAIPGFDLEAGVSHRVGIYGDHRPFLMRGVPVVNPISRPGNESWRYYHTSADTYDKVDASELALDAAFLAVLTFELAVTPEPVMQHLDEKGVGELIRRSGHEEALGAWLDMLHGRQ